MAKKKSKSKSSVAIDQKCIHEGRVSVCAHDVTFYFRCPREPDADLERCLDEEAERRVSEMIPEGYVSGELNYEGADTLDETKRIECSGWWQIES